MPRGLWERLRGARGFELLAALAIVLLLALALLRGVDGKSGSGRTELETRLENILSNMDGAGRVRAMVVQDDAGNVTGALIVADELDNVRTYLELQSAVATLLNVDLAKVEIIGRDGRFGGSS